MAHHYSNPRRADDPHVLPDVETFRHEHSGGQSNFGDDACIESEDGTCPGSGWYYWFCLPGCLPDSEPMGPFDTEAAALADAREGMDDDDEGDDA